MLSQEQKRILAFLSTALIIAPILFLTPSPFGGGVAHAAAILNDVLNFVGSAVIDFGSAIFGAPLKALVYLFFILIPQMFFFFAGVAFDTLIAFSLSSSVIKNQDFVNTGWVIMRDLSNTFFIFILLYIAISTILQTAGGQTKRLLATLVVVALLMNFSLYITKFVIDVGNVFALEFYQNISGPGVPFITLTDITPQSISAGFLSVFSLEKFNVSFTKDLFTGDFARVIFTYILVGIIYLVATFVFLSAAFLFLARVVAFWFLMILSPLAFFSTILPFTSRFWSRWFSELIGQTFLAPVFLFFVYLTMMLANTIDTLFKINPAAGPDPIVQLLLTFLTVFAILTTLLFGLKTAKSMSGHLGESMLKIGGALTGAAVGGAAMVGRNTVGRLAEHLSKTKGDEWKQSRMGQLYLSGTDKLAKSSFDARGSKAVQMAQGTVGGVNLGAAGGAGGFAKGAAADAAAIKKTGDSLKNDPAAQAKYIASLQKVGGDVRVNPDRDSLQYWSTLSSRERQEVRAAATGANKKYLDSLDEKLTGGFSEKQKKAEGKEAGKYAREVEQEGRVAKLKLAHANFETAEKAKDEQAQALASNETRDLLREMKGEEIAEIDGKILSGTAVSMHLSDKELEQIERKSNLTKGDQETLYANIRKMGREEAKAYLNASPAVKRKNASKNQKYDAQEAEEALKKGLKEAEAAKKAELAKEASEPSPENKS